MSDLLAETSVTMSFRVKDVYSRRTVLITGATGFLGKVMVEKLLYAIPDIRKIFLLIRPAKGVGPKQRLEKILQDPLFDRIRRERPEAFDKLVPVEGNLMEEHLGLSPHDMQILCEEVNIVIHSAATVKFDEQLRDAVAMNVSGTTRLIALCHKMSGLISLVHVSTAYANCDKQETEEKIYEPPVPPQKLMEALEWMNDDMVDKITPTLLGKRPNTYTLTKALAEKQLLEDAVGLPVIVIRPSIVGAMWGAPLPGWTDNINGPTGIFTAVGKGVLTNMCGDTNSKADIIPVDIVANMIIVAAAHRANIHYDNIPILHCASGDLNPVYWEKIVHFLEQFYNEYPMEQCFGVVTTQFHTSRLLFALNFYLKHYYPAVALDFVSGMMGKKKIYARLYGKVAKMTDTLHYFTTRGWTFHSKGLPQLWDTLTMEDQEEFNFDVRQVRWDQYLFDYIMGIKRYITKENLDNIPQARTNLHRLRLLRFLGQATVWYILVRLFGAKYRQKQQWIAMTVGLGLTQFYSNYNTRQRIPLKSLEEYKKTAFC